MVSRRRYVTQAPSYSRFPDTHELHEESGRVSNQTMLMALSYPGLAIHLLVGVDIIGPLPLTKKENRYILVMVDYFTKVAVAEPLKSQNAETLASIFFDRCIC
ncbi:unnamed protein product [Taenia asiatica]|uniref:Integrase catalytic domain-containing protein n=1 Tax=Taenia asiatica TaxID=60517 RepID=A0A0R3WCD5_TAEAS|nr:unnamed protein product [Taenia asiatica]